MVFHYEQEERRRKEKYRVIKMDAAIGSMKKNIASIEHCK